MTNWSLQSMNSKISDICRHEMLNKCVVFFRVLLFANTDITNVLSHVKGVSTSDPPSQIHENNINE